jgi:CheY-like chemotaxis protein
MKPDDKSPRPLKAASILVVEDHSFVLDFLERMLAGKVGGRHSARSDEDAFYNLEKTPSLAHVPIVDHYLLGVNGLKFIEKLRAVDSEVLKKMPIIMMTGDNDMELYRGLPDQTGGGDNAGRGLGGRPGGPQGCAVAPSDGF